MVELDEVRELVQDDVLSEAVWKGSELPAEGEPSLSGAVAPLVNLPNVDPRRPDSKDGGKFLHFPHDIGGGFLQEPPSDQFLDRTPFRGANDDLACGPVEGELFPGAGDENQVEAVAPE